MFRGLLKTLRPRQWVKNIFVGAPIVFARELGNWDALTAVLGAFALFCLMSGCVYVINDLVDIEKDRAHPRKRLRPIPSGELPPRVARAFVIGAVPLGLGLALWLEPLYAAALGGYFVLNLAYCFWTKNVPYLDVVSIASGFVLRVLGGAFAIGVPPSAWLMAMSAMLAMFLGFGKRAHELAASEHAVKQRASLRHYRLGALRVILTTLAVFTAVGYALYTQSPHVKDVFGDAPLIYTLPFAILGLLRFNHLVTTRMDAESPTEEMLRDVPFILNFVGWMVATGIVLYA